MSPPSDRLGPYVPSLLGRWIGTTPEAGWRTIDGTLVFVDVSGFTQLSERLARIGRVGAEELTEAINGCFAQLIEVADRAGGSVLKFGGDALLLLFTGTEHAHRASAAATGMHTALGELGELQTSAGNVRLGMSVGVHCDTVHFFLVGESHRELIITGPAATATVAVEAAAATGEVVVSASTAELLPPELVGAARGSGYLLRGAAGDRDHHAAAPGEPDSEPTRADLLPAIPAALRDHVLAERHDAEHRRVAVAFLRFGGIDERIATQGPAATAEVLDELVCAVQAAADRHDVSFLGTDIDADGGKILLAAGAPSSSGHDEESLLVALRDLAVADQPFPLRIGVNVGHVFAGDIGPSHRRTYTVMGDAVNLAARVMARAEPDQIVATAPVLAASRTTFETAELEPFHVKGKRDPVVAATVGVSLGVRDSAQDSDLPFVGRDTELAAFEEVMQAARTGTGRLVELTGEAGIGKSRLLQAFHERASELVVHHLECELHRNTTPYGAIRKLLRELLSIPADATEPDAAAQLLERLHAELPALTEWAPLLALAIGTELPHTDTTATLDERFVRPRLHDAVVALLAWAWDEPTLLTVEDAHWLDEASADVLRAVATQLRTRPWVVCMARHEPDHLTPDHAPRMQLPLEPLGPDATAELARAVTDAAPLPPHDMAELIDRSGGNPLFLQELISAAREVGGVDALPDSVGSLVTSRIDRLAPTHRGALREVSVLGYSFPRDLAAAVLTGGDCAELDALGDFLAHEGETIRFRHAIIREVAYEGLPYRRRRELHAIAGDTIAARSADQPELLSAHYHLAGRYLDAWQASIAAGERAATAYANLDAARFYERALDAARRLDEVDGVEVARISEALGDVRQRLGDAAKAGDAYRQAARALSDDVVAWARIQLKQARVKAHLKRYSQALATITRALRRLEGRDDAAARGQRAQLMVWYGHFRLEQGRHADAIGWSRDAIAEAEASGDRDALGHAYRLLDWAYVDRGEPELATYSARALELYEELGDLPNLANVRNNLGGIAYWLGSWSDALEHYASANALDEQTGDVLGAAMGRNNRAEILADQGHWAEAAELFREAERVVQASGFLSAIAYVRSNLGRTLGRLGRYDEALALLEESRSGARDVGAASQVVEAEARLAEVHVLRGRPDEALAIIEDALRRADAKEGVAAQEPLLHRVRGYALLQRGELAAARDAFTHGLEAARLRDADYELALAERALADLAAAETGQPDAELLASSQTTLDRLGVERLPEVPLAATAATAS